MNAVHIVVAMKPIEGNYADNALGVGVVGLNIDATRITVQESDQNHRSLEGKTRLTAERKIYGAFAENYDTDQESQLHSQGRWTANVIHDGSETVVKQFPDTKGGRWNNTDGARHFGHIENKVKPTKHEVSRVDEGEGSASRFFKECKT